MMFFLENVAYSKQTASSGPVRFCPQDDLRKSRKGGGGSSRNHDGASLPGVDLLCTQLDETTRR